MIMARETGRAALVLSAEQRAALAALAASRTAPLREVERAGILLQYAEGQSISAIHRQLGVSRPTIYKCIDKALVAGVNAGLKDAYHRPFAPVINNG
jgi:transposase-like protein